MRPAPVPRGLDTARIASIVALGLLTMVWSWWAIQEGAYFGSVLYPGLALLCVGFVLLLTGAPWRGNLRLSAPVRVGLAGLLGLAAWSALSALWSPSPDVAIADAQRIGGYGLAFGLGLWLCNLLGPRMHLAAVPLAVAGAAAGVAALVALLFGDGIRTYLDGDGTLQHPIGYRNANAAFFAIALWPAVMLARTDRLAWPLRAAGLAAATLCIELALLSQSRGSALGTAVALAAYVALSPARARSLAWIALATLPALVVLPAMSDLYASANEVGLRDSIDEMRDAGLAALVGVALAIGAGAAGALLERRLAVSGGAEARADRLATRGVVVAIAVAAVGFVVAVGNPVDWVGDRVEEFRTQGSPGFEGESSRFGFDTGSERLDLWRVAVDDAAADPLFGDGGGGFQYSYTREREEEGQDARDAHSVELEVLAELGIPGLLLLAAAIGGAAAGAWRARRLGPAAATLSATALAASGYWLAHASLDWFWTYPALTAPAFALLGSACAPVVLSADRGPGSGRLWLGAAAVVLALSVAPPFLSERYTDSAFASWRGDLGQAYDDLDRAQAFNALAEEPLLAEGAIAREVNDRERSAQAFRDAAARRPDDWVPHYFLALLYEDRDPELARNELELALELNPLSPRLASLKRRLASAAQRR